MDRTIVTGRTFSSNFPTTTGAFDPTFNGGSDAFMARLNAAGSALDYGTFLGGTSNDRSRGIAVDGTGRATVTGETTSSNFPTTPGAFDLSYNSPTYTDAFVARLNLDGSALDYATFLGGSVYDYGYAVAVDEDGRATVTGETDIQQLPHHARRLRHQLQRRLRRRLRDQAERGRQRTRVCHLPGRQRRRLRLRRRGGRNGPRYRDWLHVVPRLPHYTGRLRSNFQRRRLQRSTSSWPG